MKILDSQPIDVEVPDPKAVAVTEVKVLDPKIVAVEVIDTKLADVEVLNLKPIAVRSQILN